MTDTKPVKRRRLPLILALAGVVLVLVGSLSWLNRRTLARDALTGWLKSRGVASQVEVEAIGPTTFTARLQVGDPRNPDFTAERIEVRYRPKLSGMEVVSVTLRKPVLRASYRDGRLGVGALDPIVQDFLRRPPRPDTRQPRITIDDGVLMLATDYGPMRLTADALIDGGKLQALAATSAPVRLRSGTIDVSIGAAALEAVTRGGRVDVSLDAPISAAKVSDATVRDARLTFSAQLPYPDFKARRGDGAVVARARLATQRLERPGQTVTDADLALAFTGRAQGWLDDLAVEGGAVGNVQAESMTAGGASLRAVRVALTAPDVRWRRTGGDRAAATLTLNGGIGALSAGPLRMSALTATASGPFALAGGGVTADLKGSLVGRGAISGLGASAPADPPQMTALRRAARGFRIAAPAVTLRLGERPTLGLPQPVRIVADSGGVITLAAEGADALKGPLRLTGGGGGLPKLQADIAGMDLAAGQASASVRLRLRGDYGFVQGGDLDTSGRLAIGDGGVRFTGDRCAVLKVAKLEFGANDVDGVSGRLCAPLFSLDGGDWRLTGRAEAVAASVPFLQSRIEAGAARLTASARRGRISATGQVSAGRLYDTAPQTRFNPLVLTGDVTYRDFLWKADLAARLPDGASVGRAALTHDVGLGVGFVLLDTDTLTFAPGGLQPAQLSPSAEALGSPVTGAVRFNGRADWAREGASSGGVLHIPRLDFQSAAGAVEGLSGELVFTSLAPLTAAPGQLVKIEKVAGIVPLTALSARFELAENLLKIAGGEAEVGGGRVKVENLEYPLTPGAPMRGVLVFEGVQLHDLVEASPFGDKVEMDAKVSGRIPFEKVGEKIRITGGELKAVEPGRISIDRAALTGVKADTAIAAPGVATVVDPNATFTDFAYQAMENLAFDTLEATVASREDGRLGVLFHIIGKHDPPTPQRIRLTILDLIQKRFLGRKLPLPTGTGVNLTLDTTLNLDDLLADYAEYQKARAGSGPVQP